MTSTSNDTNITKNRQIVGLEVYPIKSMNDIPWHIKVMHLLPNHNYTLVSSCKPEPEANIFIAYAYYVSSENGVIDVGTMVSLGGTYTGVEPMGLMWSLTVEKGILNPNLFSPEYNGKIFMKKTVWPPMEVTISVCESFRKFEEVKDLQLISFLARKTVERLYMSPQCQRIPIREGRLRGVLFVPAGKGPFHAILDLYGGGGGLQETRAALLASHSYVTFALAYYSFDDLPAKLEIELEYFLEAIDFMLSLPYVEKSGVGILSLCFGGALAMLIATICPKAKAVVNIGGGSYLGWGIVTYQNKLLFSTAALDKVKVASNGVVMASAYPVSEELCTPIEKATNCRFLFINGEDDQCVPWSHGRMLHSRCPNRSQLCVYPETGHMIDPPFNPHIDSRWLKGLQSTLCYGGTTKGHAHAQELAWNEILAFFEKHLNIKSMI